MVEKYFVRVCITKMTIWYGIMEIGTFNLMNGFRKAKLVATFVSMHLVNISITVSYQSEYSLDTDISQF